MHTVGRLVKKLEALGVKLPAKPLVVAPLCLIFERKPSPAEIEADARFQEQIFRWQESVCKLYKSLGFDDSDMAPLG